MDDKIKKLYMNGFTYIEIAKQLNTSEIKIKHIIEKNKLLDNIQILENCDIRIPDIIQIILKLKENGKDVNIKEWTIQEMINKIVKVCNS